MAEALENVASVVKVCEVARPAIAISEIRQIHRDSEHEKVELDDLVDCFGIELVSLRVRLLTAQNIIHQKFLAI